MGIFAKSNDDICLDFCEKIKKEFAPIKKIMAKAAPPRSQKPYETKADWGKFVQEQRHLVFSRLQTQLEFLPAPLTLELCYSGCDYDPDSEQISLRAHFLLPGDEYDGLYYCEPVCPASGNWSLKIHGKYFHFHVATLPLFAEMELGLASRKDVRSRKSIVQFEFDWIRSKVIRHSRTEGFYLCPYFLGLVLVKASWETCDGTLWSWQRDLGAFQPQPKKVWFNSDNYPTWYWIPCNENGS